jgi:hypothetical protein
VAIALDAGYTKVSILDDRDHAEIMHSLLLVHLMKFTTVFLSILMHEKLTSFKFYLLLILYNSNWIIACDFFGFRYHICNHASNILCCKIPFSSIFHVSHYSFLSMCVA